MRIFTKSRLLLNAALAVLLVINVFVYLGARNYVQDFAYDRIDSSVYDLQGSLESRVQLYQTVLRGAAALFAAKEDLTQVEWNKYIDEVHVMHEHPGMEVLGFAPVIRPQEVDVFVAQARAFGNPTFAIRPSVPTDLYVPVYWLEPLTDAVRPAIGFNMYSEEKRKAAIDYAIDNNTIAVTGKIVPASEQNNPKATGGFVMFAPIYKNGLPIDTPEQRRQNILGFVTAGIRPNELFSGVSLSVAPGVVYQIFDSGDQTNLSEQNLLYNSGSGAVIQPGYASYYTNVKTLEWPNATWVVKYLTDSDLPLIQVFRTAPYVVLIISLLVSSLIFIFLQELVRRYQHMGVLVGEYGAKLITEDAIVDESEFCLIATDEEGLITVFNMASEHTLGYHQSHVVKQLHITELFVNFPQFDDLIAQSLVEGTDKKEVQVRLQTGQIVPMQAMIKPLYSAKTELIGYRFRLM